MTIEEIRNAIENHIYSSWGTATAIARPNNVFTPPEETNWVKYYIKFGQSFPGEIKGIGIRVSIVQFEINTPVNVGLKPGTALCDRAELMFRYQDVSGINFGEPYTADLGSQGVYYSFMVTAPFECFVGE